jgi:hypothetical protein
MAFCATCGKEIEDGKPCPDCDAPGTPVPETVPPQAAPTAATPFTKRFMGDPIGTVRDVWQNNRIKYAWVAIGWIFLAMLLETFITQTISMIKYSQPFFPTVFKTVLRALTDPLPTLAGLVVGALAIKYLAAKEPDGKSVTFTKVLAALGAASLPYAAALTLAIPVYAVVYIFDANLFGEILSYYNPVVLYPLRIAALFLTLAVYREMSGNTDNNRLVRTGVVVLVAQALAGMVIGLLLYMLNI